MKKLIFFLILLSSFASAQMPVGLMPAYVADKYDIGFTRKVVYASTWNSWFKSKYTDSISLNVNNSMYKGDYTHDTTWFKSKVKQIASTLQPMDIVIQNEELLDGDIARYCHEITAASHVATVTNGGITTAQLSYLYWTTTHDSEFFRYNIFKKDSLLKGYFLPQVINTSFEINVLASLNIPYINVHYYIGNSNQVAGLIRMFKWLSATTGKQLTCNEAGIYAEGLLPYVIYVAQQCNMKYLILYSGMGTTGSGKALPISKSLFLSVR